MPSSWAGSKRSYRAASPEEDQPVKRQRPNAFATRNISLHLIHGDETQNAVTILPKSQPEQQLISPAARDVTQWPSSRPSADTPAERRAAIPSDFCKFKATTTNAISLSSHQIGGTSETDRFSRYGNTVESVVQTVEQGVLRNIYPYSPLHDKFNAIHALVDLAYATSFRSELSAAAKKQRLFDRIFEGVFQILALLKPDETHQLISDRNFMGKLNALKSRPWWSPSQDALEWDWIGLYDLIDIVNPPARLDLDLWRRKASDYYCSVNSDINPVAPDDEMHRRLAEVRSVLETSIRRGVLAKLTYRTCVDSKRDALSFLALVGNWFVDIWRREPLRNADTDRITFHQHSLVTQAMEQIFALSSWEEQQTYLKNADFVAHLQRLHMDREGLFPGLHSVLQQLSIPESTFSLPRNEDVIGDLMMIEAY